MSTKADQIQYRDEVKGWVDAMYPAETARSRGVVKRGVARALYATVHDHEGWSGSEPWSGWLRRLSIRGSMGEGFRDERQV